MDNLFTNIHSNMKPLAEKMRPKSLNDFVGQQHILGQGKLLRRLIEAKRVPSVIFYGPPGTGKTTLASIIAESAGARFVKMNAVSSGVADVKVVIAEAQKNFEMYGKKTYLLLDECHRWSKTQSDSLLGCLESGEILLIGSTTENPNYNMTRAIVSRCSLFEFKRVEVEVILMLFVLWTNCLKKTELQLMTKRKYWLNMSVGVGCSKRLTSITKVGKKSINS